MSKYIYKTQTITKEKRKEYFATLTHWKLKNCFEEEIAKRSLIDNLLRDLILIDLLNLDLLSLFCLVFWNSLVPIIFLAMFLILIIIVLLKFLFLLYRKSIFMVHIYKYLLVIDILNYLIVVCYLGIVLLLSCFIQLLNLFLHLHFSKVIITYFQNFHVLLRTIYICLYFNLYSNVLIDLFMFTLSKQYIFINCQDSKFMDIYIYFILFLI